VHPAETANARDDLLDGHRPRGVAGICPAGGDLQTWLDEHAGFLTEPSNTALIRALIAAAAARPADGEDLYQQLSAPQVAGLTSRLRSAVEAGHIDADADLDAIAEALIGTMMFRALTDPGAGEGGTRHFGGLLDAILHGVSKTDHSGAKNARMAAE
jgi:hypothetical protein